MPIIPQTLSINILRTTDAKSIKLHTIRKLIGYFLENVVFKGNVYPYRFRDIAARRQNGIINRPAGYRERKS